MRISRTGLGLIATMAVAVSIATASDRGVTLRSGTIEPGRQAVAEADAEGQSGVQRWVVRFKQTPDILDRSRIEIAGAKIDAPLPGQAYIVSLPANRAPSLAAIPGVDWAVPYLPQDKLSPEIASVRASDNPDETVIVLLHLFGDSDSKAVAGELAAAGLQMEGARDGSRFGRVTLSMSAEQLEARRAELAERSDVFWIGRRHRRTLTNDTSIWVGQSGLDGGETTPVFDQGIYGDGQIAAVLDTGLDADACYFRDGTLGLPPTNTAGGTVVDMNQRKVIAADFLDPAENPADPTHWDTQGHGTHVTGIMAGDDLATPIGHDTADGMAPAAKLIIQDAGFGADSCGDLPGIGCPVTDLIPVFQQAYDQGARTHTNSWNDNENAQVQNNYTDASEDVDEFMWNNPDFLIVFACGNRALGGVGTMGSPSTAKNVLSVGGTFKGEFAEFLSDISAWGPTDDGRIKPDVVFPAASIISCGNDGDVTTNTCTTSSSTGTSMAAPGAAGMSMLVREYFADGFYPTGAAVPGDAFDAGSALVKAMLINSAVPINFDAEGRPITIPSDPQGWGRILLDNVLHFDGDSRGLWVDEQTTGFLSPVDAPITYIVDVTDSSEPLKITLAWNDFPSTPAATTHLINDLDLRVDGPSGGFWGNSFRDGASWDLGGEPDRLNNVEQVLVQAPAPGKYSIRISPHAIPSGPQPWSLVVTGGFSLTTGPRPSYLLHTVDDSGPGGNGDGVLDPGETAVLPITLHNPGDGDATSVLGELYSAFPDQLKVYRSSAPYADMPVGAQASSASPHYEVTLEPSASCGSWTAATMGISGDGFDVGSAFQIDVGEYEADVPSTDTPRTIPDNNTTGIYSPIVVPNSFPVTGVTVTVDIDHQDISELRLVLFAPDNSLVFLHNYTQPGVSGLQTSYPDPTPVAMGDMDDFLDIDPQGTWRLRAIDNSGGTVGTLQSWSLHFDSDIPFDCNPVSCGQPVPSAVGDTITMTKAGASDLVVQWTGVGSSEYNVWRSDDRELRTAVHAGSSGGTALIDSGAQTLPGVHYYVVRSVNSCRWESP